MRRSQRIGAAPLPKNFKDAADLTRASIIAERAQETGRSPQQYFERFFDLYEGKIQGTRKEKDDDGQVKVVGWRPEDYVGDDTPEWALWGNGGFDPRDVRVWRKGKGKKDAGEVKEVGIGAIQRDAAPLVEI